MAHIDPSLPKYKALKEAMSLMGVDKDTPNEIRLELLDSIRHVAVHNEDINMMVACSDMTEDILYAGITCPYSSAGLKLMLQRRSRDNL